MSDGGDTHGAENDDSGERRDRRDGPTAEVTLVARVQAYDGRPDTCTIHPVNADDWTVLTTWISAERGGFVLLDEMR